MTDPATWREAARQLREEAAFDASFALESMARRFENEAKAAEKEAKALESRTKPKRVAAGKGRRE